MSDMQTPEVLASNPEWFPHRIDTTADQILFVRLPRETHRRLTFLSDEYMDGLGPRQVLRVREIEPRTRTLEKSPCHFIFHSAFCCSTLLARALDIQGAAMTLKEPTALMELADAALATGHTGRIRPALDTVLDLMARPFSPGEAVIIKPTNVCNPLIEQMLSSRPEARAILLHAPLPSFLQSLAKKGLWGRLWARRAFASIMRAPVFDPGYSEAERWEHSDLQVAALLWLQQQAQFAKLVQAQPHGRVVTLDSETFLKNPTQTLVAASDLFGLTLSAETLAEIAHGPVFASNSKQHGETFDAQRRADEHARAQAAYGEEIAMVVRWAQSVAAHVGAPMTLDAPLIA